MNRVSVNVSTKASSNEAAVGFRNTRDPRYLGQFGIDADRALDGLERRRSWRLRITEGCTAQALTMSDSVSMNPVSRSSPTWEFAPSTSLRISDLVTSFGLATNVFGRCRRQLRSLGVQERPKSSVTPVWSRSTSLARAASPRATDRDRRRTDQANASRDKEVIKTV